MENQRKQQIIQQPKKALMAKEIEKYEEKSALAAMIIQLNWIKLDKFSSRQILRHMKKTETVT